MTNPFSIKRLTKKIERREHSRTDECFLNDIPYKTIAPEKRLLWAILERTFRDMTYPVLVNKDFMDAASFVFYKRKVPFSFLWMCEQLDIEPNTYIKAVKKNCTTKIDWSKLLDTLNSSTLDIR